MPCNMDRKNTGNLPMSTYRNRLLVERKDRRRPAMRKKGDKNTPSDFGPYVDSLDGNVRQDGPYRYQVPTGVDALLLFFVHVFF